jgi:hypothetical protein
MKSNRVKKNNLKNSFCNFFIFFLFFLLSYIPLKCAIFLCLKNKLAKIFPNNLESQKSIFSRRQKTPSSGFDGRSKSSTSL